MLLKIRNILSEATGVQQLVLVHVLNPASGGRFQIPSGHIRVGKQLSGRDIPIVSISVVIGQVHIILSREMQWIVNYRIDL